jgi:hypothetical protein
VTGGRSAAISASSGTVRPAKQTDTKVAAVSCRKDDGCMASRLANGPWHGKSKGIRSITCCWRCRQRRTWCVCHSFPVFPLAGFLGTVSNLEPVQQLIPAFLSAGAARWHSDSRSVWSASPDLSGALSARMGVRKREQAPRTPNADATWSAAGAADCAFLKGQPLCKQQPSVQNVRPSSAGSVVRRAKWHRRARAGLHQACCVISHLSRRDI